MSMKGVFEGEANEPRSGASSAGVSGGGRLGLLLLAVFGAYLGQFILFPVLPPLGRELGLSEAQVGFLITTAAFMLFVASPIWGRRSDSWGRKPMILLGLVASAVCLLIFAVVAQFGIAGVLSATTLFVAMLVVRGFMYGLSLAAVPAPAQAYVADVTVGESERTKGVAAIGAAQALTLVLGPALGGLLAGISLLAPFYFAPLVALVVAAVVWRFLPEPERREGERSAAVRLSPLDGRLWPFLVTGFGMFLSLGTVLITVGFLYQDRLSLSAEATAQVVGAALFVTGVVLMVTQGLIVPRLGWPVLRLIRTGIPVAAVGFLLLSFASGFLSLTLGMAVLALGLGVAIPGYTAAPTLLVSSGEQGSVAGLMNSANALAFVIGPLLGTSLYQLRPELPFLAGAALIAGIFVFTLLHPGVRQVASGRT
jgi:MFS transporter, DHA1 family, tetracycline resistance protein